MTADRRAALVEKVTRAATHSRMMKASTELKRAVAALNKATADLSEKERDRLRNLNTELSGRMGQAATEASIRVLRAKRRVVKAAVAYVSVSEDTP